MKKLLQMTVLVASLAGLSACASNGSTGFTSGDSLDACKERVARLEKMNKACYRK